MTEPIEERLLKLADEVAKLRPGWFRDSFYIDIHEDFDSEDMALIKACDPDTIKKLCRVVEAARELEGWGNDPALNGHLYDARQRAEFMHDLDELHAALAALDKETKE